MGLTQGRLVANSVAQKIPRAHCGQLRKPLHKPLGLCSFSNPRCTDENDASGAFELLGGHSEAVCRYAKRRSRSALTGEGPGLGSCSWQGEKLEASGSYILQHHVEIMRGVYKCTKSCADAQQCDRRRRRPSDVEEWVGRSAKTF